MFRLSERHEMDFFSVRRLARFIVSPAMSNGVVGGGVVGGLDVCCHQARPEPRTIKQISRFRCGC